MGVVLNTNMSALSAYHNLRKSQDRVETATERLASGLRINRAADDAAGLAISEKLRSQVNGLNQAQRNIQDGVSVMQTADGGLTETHALLQRMRTLAVQAANSGVMSSAGLRAIQVEMTQLTADIDHVAYGSEFNSQRLLDGTFYQKNLQVGANAGDAMEVSIYSGITPAIPPVPPSTTPAQPAREALWDVDKTLSSLPDLVTFAHTLAGATTTVAVSMPTPRPSNVSDLAALLNADGSFNSAFEAATGSYQWDDGINHPDVNLIITAKIPGAGHVEVTGVGSTSKQYDPGSDPVDHPGIPGQPERIRGYAAADILLSAIDVTRLAGSSTTPGYSYSSGGGNRKGFGEGGHTTPTTITVPPVTTTWGSGADEALGVIDRAIDIVSRGRADIGAHQNRLEHAARSVSVGEENMAASESRLRDTDVALEMSKRTKDQIVAQAGASMLAQARQAPQAILKLLPNG